MTRIILDDDLKSWFKEGSEALEICDTSGQTLGFFHPLDVHDRSVYEWFDAVVSGEELERARQDPRRYTTAEVLEHLRSL